MLSALHGGVSGIIDAMVMSLKISLRPVEFIKDMKHIPISFKNILEIGLKNWIALLKQKWKEDPEGVMEGSVEVLTYLRGF